METITNYIDNLFRGYPDTPQVRKAKEDLLGIMEDKYNELKNDGKSEHEAIGIVISEFGSMDEIALELGLKKEETESVFSNKAAFPQKRVSLEEAQNYIKARESFGIKIAIGVALCILSPTASAFSEAFCESGFLAQNISEMFGAISLFSMVAIAVAVFIVTGISQNKYEAYKDNEILLDSKTTALLNEQQEAFRPVFGAKIAIGVALCILSVTPAIISEAFLRGRALNFGSALSAASLFLFVAVGVFLFITAGAKQGAYDTLLGKNRSRSYRAKRKKDKRVSIIASIYWPVVTAIYLGWSLVTFRWNFTWIVWPIAGVLFGGISAAISLITEE